MRTFLTLLLGTPIFAQTLNPQAAQWSTKSYGPNGPWNAVTVFLGTPPQQIDLLPGGSWMTNVLAPSVCTNGADCTIAKSAGFYDPTLSNTTYEIGQTGFVDHTDMAGTVGAIPTVNGTGYWMFDTVQIPFTNGVSANSYQATVQNFDLLVIDAGTDTLPDGSTYVVQIGKLALGAPDFNQTWNHYPPNPRWNGTLLPSALFQAGLSPSNSYGLHIGSASLKIPGSLHIGGYDQSRALGLVSSQVYAIDHLPIDLLDIGIGVAEGGSPFSFTSKSGLLAAGNSSIGFAMSVLVEAPVEYIYLPQSTCDAITQNLPVTYQAKYGVYFWDTSDPNYQKIVSSPSFLSFTFRLSGSTSQNMTINVPFSLLNLTLSAPIIDTPTAYLPLRPTQGPSGNYELGRAFLQAAFVGVNWESAEGADGTGTGTWFLAQAPGPNTPTLNPLTTIATSDTSIVGSTNSWVDTWKGAWTVLDASGISNGSSISGTPSPSTRVSAGAMAGIAIGTLFVVGLAILGAFLLWKRSTKKRAEQPAEIDASQTVAGPTEVVGGEPVFSKSLTNLGAIPGELDSGKVAPRYELGG